MGEFDALLRRREELPAKIWQGDLGVRQILQAIEKQRWYFFDNKPTLIFDSKTALLWANLNNFAQVRYSWANSYKEVHRFIVNLNSVGVEGHRNWRVPTAEELWELVEDTTFPLCHLSRRINEEWCWCVVDEGILKGKDLDINGETNGLSAIWNVHVIPCCDELVAQGYSPEPQEILDIFVENNLQPKFADKELTRLFRQFLGSGRNEKVRRRHKKYEPAFDYRTLLEKFDVAEIDSSVIRYYEAAIGLADEILAILKGYERRRAAITAPISKVAAKLEVGYVSERFLTAEENSMLEARQDFLARAMSLRMEEVRAQIFSIRAEASAFAARIDKINRGKNILRELAALESEPRASFAFLAENVARIIQASQRQMDFCEENKNFVALVANAWDNWNNGYKLFKTKQRDEFIATCRKKSISEKVYPEWYEEWRQLRFKIEEKFLPLVEFAFQGNLLAPKKYPIALKVLEILREYRNVVDQFYLSERLELHRQFKGKPQEKISVDRVLNIFAENFKRSMQTTALICEHLEERIFLERWAESL